MERLRAGERKGVSAHLSRCERDAKEIERLQAHLRKHGDHIEKCPAHPANWETALPAGACIPNCGWAAIEEGLRQ